MKQKATTPAEFLATMASIIHQERMIAKMTQAELAKHAAVPESTIKRIEAGKPVTLLYLLQIMQSLQLLHPALSALQKHALRDPRTPMQVLLDSQDGPQTSLRAKPRQRVRHSKPKSR